MTTNQNIYIPKDTVENITGFLIMNAAQRVVRSLPVATMYALAGSSGSGKTTAFKTIAAALGVHLEVVPASSLSGAYSGQSSIPVREGIIRAAQSDKWMSAVLIDDLDATDARVDDNLSGTISTMNLNATLMAYADNPFQLTINDDPDKPVRVIPLERPPAILITCNDLSKLYGPLIRDGRMKHGILDPKGKEVVPIVRAMYPQSRATDIEKLVADYPDASIAFFKQLGIAVAEDFAKQTARTAKTHLPGFDFGNFARQISSIALGATYEQLKVAAEALASTDRGKNFLKTAA